jgi:rhomboid protease GluP
MPSPVIPPRVLADRLVSILVADGCTLRAYDDDQAVLERDGRTYLILQAPGAFERLPKLGQIGNAEVVVLGGTRDVRARLKKARPWVTQGRVHLFHVGDDGDLWQDSVLGKTTLGAFLRRRQDLPAVDPQQLTALVGEAQTQYAAQVQEVQQFHQTIGARTPIATYALAAIIGVCFGLELLWGGSESMPTLVRMGALVRERALDEPWRLLSCTFLHAGFMHVLFNVYVLVALGTTLERILGRERFLVLYVASAIGGSLASTLVLDDGVSVGASGAIWGLLAAEAMLAHRPGGLLPAILLPGLKRAALINLAINVVNSFRPDVDWAAHFGGGIVGGLLVLTGVLTLGLPRLAELTAEQTPEDRKPMWLRPAAVALTGLLVAGGAYGLLQGAAWSLTAKQELTRRSLGDSGFGIELPSMLGEPKELRQQPGQVTAVYGDLLSDMVVVEVLVIRFESPLPADQLAIEFQALEEALATSAPPGGKLVGQPRQLSEGNARYSISLYRFENGLTLEHVGFLTPGFGGRVDVGMWPQFRDAGYAGLAETAARSIRP